MSDSLSKMMPNTCLSKFNFQITSQVHKPEEIDVAPYTMKRARIYFEHAYPNRWQKMCQSLFQKVGQTVKHVRIHVTTYARLHISPSKIRPEYSRTFGMNIFLCVAIWICFFMTWTRACINVRLMWATPYLT